LEHYFTIILVLLSGFTVFFIIEKPLTLVKNSLKGIVHLKMKIYAFIHPYVISNLYEFLSSVEHKRRYFEER